MGRVIVSGEVTETDSSFSCQKTSSGDLSTTTESCHSLPLQNLSCVEMPEHNDQVFDLRSYLAEQVTQIETALQESLPLPIEGPSPILESMRYSLLAGGKRLRPILVLASCRLCGGKDSWAMPTAVAVEMIHTMSLVHDDLPAMDNDALRRGVPANHVVYGEATAILAGDALLSTAFQHVATSTPSEVPAERILGVIRRMGAEVGPNGLAGGQARDLEVERTGRLTTLEELEWIHSHKTASLLRLCVGAGALLAGASPEDIAILESFADKIGLAFQIVDDILDVTGTSAALGKSVGKDAAASKPTFASLMGLSKSQKYAQSLIDDAKSALNARFGDRAYPLLTIADYIIARKS